MRAVTSEAVQAVPTGSRKRLPRDRFLNRELSWLEFNSRVLELAEDESLALLERVKFLAIFASNLDEFYMVRVAGLKRRDETGLSVRSADGLTPREQLARIAARTQELAGKHARIFLDEVRPALDDAGVHIVDWAGVSPEARERLEMYGNGCAGSTASGVSTGKTCSRKYVRRRSRSGASRSAQRTSWMLSAASFGSTSSAKQLACRVTSSAARWVIISSWLRSETRSPPRIGRPALRRRLRPATRTM